jgi:hypothetical protein
MYGYLITPLRLTPPKLAYFRIPLGQCTRQNKLLGLMLMMPRHDETLE